MHLEYLCLKLYSYLPTRNHAKTIDFSLIKRKENMFNLKPYLPVSPNVKGDEDLDISSQV